MNEYSVPGEGLRSAPLQLQRSVAPDDKSDFDLREILAHLYSHFPLIAVTAFLFMVLATAAIWQIEKQYSATALLEIDSSEAEMVGVVQENTLTGTTLTSLIETHVEALNSTRIALSVIESLKLWRDEEFGLQPDFSFMKLVTFDQTPELRQDVTAFDQLTNQQRADLVRRLSRKMNIARRGLTSIIGITAKSKSQEKSASIANAFANAYIDVTIETRLQMAQRAETFLQKQLDVLADNIKTTDAAMTKFVLDNADKFGTAETQALLSSFKTKVSTLDSSRTEMLRKINEIRQITESNDFSRATTLDLGARFAELAAQRATLAASAPGNTALTENLAEMEKELRSIAAERLGQAYQNIKTYDSDLADVRKSISDLIASQNVPAELSVGLFRLQKEALNYQRLYESYAARLGDVGRIVSLPIASSRLIAEAIPPAKANAPSRTLLMMIAAVLAAGFGVGAGIIRHYYLGGFSSATQLEAVSGLPVIANVIESNENPTTSISENPDSVFGESIRRLRIGLDSVSASGEATTILFTSTHPGEGKTTLALCVGNSFAVAGRRTLLIDGDLRRPSLAKVMGITKFGDLIDLVTARESTIDLSKYVYHHKASGLDILLSGERGDMASDLVLSSAKFNLLVQAAKREYDYVLFDSPPVGHTVDALVLQRQADKIVYVVARGSTNQREVMSSVRQMQRQQSAPPIYFVLNRTKSVLTGYGYAAPKYGY